MFFEKVHDGSYALSAESARPLPQLRDRGTATNCFTARRAALQES